MPPGPQAQGLLPGLWAPTPFVGLRPPQASDLGGRPRGRHLVARPWVGPRSGPSLAGQHVPDGAHHGRQALLHHLQLRGHHLDHGHTRQQRGRRQRPGGHSGPGRGPVPRRQVCHEPERQVDGPPRTHSQGRASHGRNRGSVPGAHGQPDSAGCRRDSSVCPAAPGWPGRGPALRVSAQQNIPGVEGGQVCRPGSGSALRPLPALHFLLRSHWPLAPGEAQKPRSEQEGRWGELSGPGPRKVSAGGATG